MLSVKKAGKDHLPIYCIAQFVLIEASGYCSLKVVSK